MKWTDSAKSALHSGFVHLLNKLIETMISAWRIFTVHFDKITGQQLYFLRLKWVNFRLERALLLFWSKTTLFTVTISVIPK